MTNPPGFVFRLYTERRPNLRQIVDFFVPAATFYRAKGLWHGLTEDSMVIEIVGSEADTKTVRALARAIRKASGQSSVLMTAVALRSVEFVTG